MDLLTQQLDEAPRAPAVCTWITAVSHAVQACNSRFAVNSPDSHVAHLLQVVNGPSHPGAVGNPPSSITPPPPKVQGMGSQAPSGWRELLLKEGPEKWAHAIRQHKGVLITDTTM